MSLIWQHYPEGGGELLLALALADHADDKGDRVYPSVESLAAKIRQSERNVQRLLRNIEGRGWLELVSNEKGGRNTPRRYRIPVEQILKRVTYCHPLEKETVTPGSPFPENKGRHPAHERVTPSAERVTPSVLRGDIAVSPESSVIIKEPSRTTIHDSVAPARPTDVQIVFTHWQTKLNHPQAKLTPERQRKIKTALKNYSASQLCKAIDGCAVTPHNMGDNDRGEVYDDIALILRDAAHIERFMRNADTPPTGGNHEANNRIDNSAPARVQRAIDERERKRQARGE